MPDPLLNPVAVIDELLDNNRVYAEGFEKGHLPSAPARSVAILACMDARLDIHKILGLNEGDAHVIRNAGGVASDDALRSLVISQRLLGTASIVLVHHTDCGMLSLSEEDVQQEIERETGLRLPFRLQAFSDLERETIQALRRLRGAAFLPHRDDVRGFIYDVETGTLEEVDAS